VTYRHDTRPVPVVKRVLYLHEYFQGDTGAGVGASHQTGWTALVAKLLEQASGSTQSMGCRQMPLDSRQPASVRR
jgi:hypothetical protein